MTILRRQPSEAAVTAVAAVVAVLAAAGMLWPAAFAGRVPAFGDNISFWAPNTAFWSNEVKQGCFPFWNPYIMSGVPFAADINHGIYYPPNWIVLAAGVAGGLRLLVILHAAAGIFGIYLFARSQGLQWAPALWAGALFGVSEAFLPLAEHIVMLESMSYIGFALYAAARLGGGAGVKAAVLLAVVMALSALAGDVHATYIIGLAVAAVAAIEAWRKAAHREVIGAAAVLGLAAAAAVAAALLAAIALLPAAQLTMMSERGAGGDEYAGYHSLDPKAGIGAVLPGIWGTIAGGTVWNFRAGNAIYLGIVVITLAVYGARRNVLASLAPIGLVVAGVLLSLGAYSPLGGGLRAGLPGFTLFRQPREYFIIAVVGFVVLAAKGISDIAGAVRQVGPRKVAWNALGIVCLGVVAGSIGAVIARETIAAHLARALEARYDGAALEIARRVTTSLAQAGIVAGLAGAAACAWRSGALSGRTAAAVTAAVVAADFGIVSSGWLVFGPSKLCDGRPALAEAVKATAPQPVDVRIAVNARGFGEYFDQYADRRISGRLEGEEKTFATLFQVKECLTDDETLYLAVPSAMGYSTFVTARYAALWEAAFGGRPSPVRLRIPDGSYAASIEGVTMARSERPALDYRLLGVSAVIEASADWTDCRVRRIEPPGAVRMVYDWQPVAGFEQARDALKAGREAALTGPVIEGVQRAPAGPQGAQVLHAIENAWRGTDVFTVQVHTDAPGMLVVGDCNYPGWKAYDNGSEIPIRYANLAMRAVYLGAGKHDVEFRFRPTVFYVGAAVTAGALVGLVAVLLLLAEKERDE